MVEGDYVVPNSQRPRRYSELDFVYHLVTSFAEDETAENAIAGGLAGSASVEPAAVSALYGQPGTSQALKYARGQKFIRSQRAP